MTSVSALFEKLAREGFSGEVEVTASQGHAVILIKQGRFVWAHRTFDRATERFQKVSWLQMPQQNLPAMKSWADFVMSLLEANADQLGRVVRLLKMDRLEVFFRIFFWSNVEMIPRPLNVEEMLSASELGFYSLRQFDALLTEAKRRISEWPLMKQKMGSSRRIFMSQVEPSSLKVDYENEDAFNQPSGASASVSASGIPQVPFTTEEIELLRHCDGRNTVQDLVRVFPEGEFLIVQRLLDLWRKGAIRPKDDEESVISIHARSDEISPKDIVGSVWTAFIISVLFLIIARANSATPSFDGVPQEITQALAVYRKIEGHYPLTLNELPSKLYFAREKLRLFDYSVPDPSHYEIKPKAITH